MAKITFEPLSFDLSIKNISHAPNCSFQVDTLCETEQLHLQLFIQFNSNFVISHRLTKSHLISLSWKTPVEQKNSCFENVEMDSAPWALKTSVCCEMNAY